MVALRNGDRLLATARGGGRTPDRRIARGFSAGLARQFRADHTSPGYGRDGLSAGWVKIALAGSPAGQQASQPEAGTPGAQVRCPGRRAARGPRDGVCW
jgi:hypothetical protein